MIRSVLCTLLVLLVLLNVGHSQVPTYRYSRYDTTGFPSAALTFTVDDNKGFKWQSIYYPTNFPGMPAGMVKAVYIRIGNNGTGTTTANFPAFTTKIGYTNDSTFPNGPNKYDTFKTGLTTIYGPATFIVTHTDSIGLWVKIPVTTGSFNYSTERKFVVEFAMGPKTNGSGFDIMFTNVGALKKWRTIGGYRDSIRAFNNSFISMMDIGFDLATTGIDNVENITSFGLFPNPATNGRFNITYEAQQPVKKATVTVTNAAGQLVFQQQYHTPGNSLFKEINIGRVAGNYFMELVADGERIVRKIVVE